MRLQKKIIKVNKFLQELLGKETTAFDLLLIFIAVVALVLTVQFLAINIELTIYKKIALIFLSIDIGGGIVANFTKGTDRYYSEESKKQNIFLLLHIIQPLILSWIFPNEITFILTITAYTLFASFVAIKIKNRNTQRLIAAFLLYIGIFISFIFNPSNQLILLLMLVYEVKLILAFSVRWTNIKSVES